MRAKRPMTEEELYALKYPIGEFECPENITPEILNAWIECIASFPSTICGLTENLSNEEKAWVYRPGGWSVKQLVHHCADSHMNSLTRFKWTLTEDLPTIKAYDENRWITLSDAKNDDLEASLQLISGLHTRWVHLLKSLSEKELDRCFVHPENGKTFSLKETVGNYAWHCEQHLAHIRQALAAKGKYN